MLLKKRNLSGGVFFADIATAYYSVIKELGTGVSADDSEAIARIFKYTGCSEIDFDRFRALLDCPARQVVGSHSTLPI